MKKPAIPSVPPQADSLYNLLASIKENVEQITGVRGGQLTKLSSTATNDDIIGKINEIIDRLNAS